MSNEVRLWQIESDENLNEIQRASLDLEARLQDWLARDISILDPGLVVIGREVETDFGGYTESIQLRFKVYEPTLLSRLNVGSMFRERLSDLPFSVADETKIEQNY